MSIQPSPNQALQRTAPGGHAHREVDACFRPERSLSLGSLGDFERHL
jgi:hypothetical protein